MTLQEQRDALIEYMKAKLEQEDWHGVSDAANDLRVLDVQILKQSSVSARRSS